MGSNDLYLHIGRKSGKTITGEVIQREYEKAVQEQKKQDRLQTLFNNGARWKVYAKGNCTACGKPLGEDDGLFLCAECQEKNKDFFTK